MIFALKFIVVTAILNAALANFETAHITKESAIAAWKRSMANPANIFTSAVLTFVILVVLSL